MGKKWQNRGLNSVLILSFWFVWVWMFFFAFFYFTDHVRDNINFHSNKSLHEELRSTWEKVDKHVSGMHESNSERHGSRRKRFLSYPRFVELMITADAKMVQHHGHNLEHYILTIMSVVSKNIFVAILSYACFLCLCLYRHGPVLTF